MANNLNEFQDVETNTTIKLLSSLKDNTQRRKREEDKLALLVGVLVQTKNMRLLYSPSETNVKQDTSTSKLVTYVGKENIMQLA